VATSEPVVLHHGREGGGDGRDEGRPTASTACWAAFAVGLHELEDSRSDAGVSGIEDLAWSWIEQVSGETLLFEPMSVDAIPLEKVGWAERDAPRRELPGIELAPRFRKESFALADRGVLSLGFREPVEHERCAKVAGRRAKNRKRDREAIVPVVLRARQVEHYLGGDSKQLTRCGGLVEFEEPFRLFSVALCREAHCPPNYSWIARDGARRRGLAP
jgi:hypothetical protein